MAIPPEHVQSYLSCAYVQAVAAHAGAALAIPQDYGDDGHIQYVKKVGTRYRATGFILHCQIKATTNWSYHGEEVIYDIDAEAYNKLAEWEGQPCILVLFCMPRNPDDWLQLTGDQLILRHCCYWSHILGKPTANTSRIRIRIPRSQLFTPEVVQDLLAKIRRDGCLR